MKAAAKAGSEDRWAVWRNTAHRLKAQGWRLKVNMAQSSRLKAEGSRLKEISN